MSRRRNDQAPTDPDLPAGGAPLRLDLVVAESEEEMEGWTREDRQLYAELLEDAGSELQRELIRRALAAGHRPAELHAFADSIRPLSDAEAFAACTPPPEWCARKPLDDRLTAEADPLFSYGLNGGQLSPRREISQPEIRLPEIRLADSPAVDLITNPGLRQRRELGSSADEPTTTGRFDAVRSSNPALQSVQRSSNPALQSVQRSSNPALQSPGAGRSSNPSLPGLGGDGRFAEKFFNDALWPLGIRLTEQLVDGMTGLPLDKALARAAEALMTAIPVPVVLGAHDRDFRRYALMLQVQMSGNSRVFQVHDPFAYETVWIHEGDFRAKKELPFSDKALRAIAAIALPDAGGRR